MKLIAMKRKRARKKKSGENESIQSRNSIERRKKVSIRIIIWTGANAKLSAAIKWTLEYVCV